MGGVALAATGGLGMPVALLEPSPFSSFIAPGVILAVVVGGSQVLAVALLLLKRALALVAAATAAFAMLIWVYVEVSMLLFYHWLQTVYFASGITQLAVVLVLLGVWRGRPGLGSRP